MWTIRCLVEVILFLANGIYTLLGSCRDFRDLEIGIYRLVQEAARKMLEIALKRMDERLLLERDRGRLEVVHTRTRKVLTAFGEIEVKRRYYRDRETGEGKFLLDEALGLEPRQRLSPWLRELAGKLAVEMPYHRAAGVLGELVPGVSAMGIWQVVQRAGDAERRAAEAAQAAVFERGEAPVGERKVEELCVEADGVLIRGRSVGKKKRWIEVKLAVGYEGKERVAPGRKVLRERRVAGAVAEPEVFWEQVVADFARKWDWGSLKRCVVGADGAAWLKAGCEYFPGALYRLDPYHLRRALVEGLAHDADAYVRVSEAVAAGDWSAVERALGEAERGSRGECRRKVRALWGYLRENWEGICSSGVGERLGAIEGQVFHHVGRRMKRHGARWSDRGADHLVRLLAARANGELGRALGPGRRAWAELMRVAVGSRMIETDSGGEKAEDVGAWLRARVPALTGPYAGRPWVKYVLRELTRVGLEVS